MQRFYGNRSFPHGMLCAAQWRNRVDSYLLPLTLLLILHVSARGFLAMLLGCIAMGVFAVVIAGISCWVYQAGDVWLDWWD